MDNIIKEKTKEEEERKEKETKEREEKEKEDKQEEKKKEEERKEMEKEDKQEEKKEKKKEEERKEDKQEEKKEGEEKETKDEKKEIKMCHICYDDSKDEALISPCKCIGSMKWLHHSCLKKWLEISKRKDCSSCKYVYQYEKKYKKTYFKYLDHEYVPKIATISSILLGIILSGLICYFIYFRRRKTIHIGFNINYLFFSIKCFLFIFLGIMPILHFCKVIDLRESYNSYISLYERENIALGQSQNFTDIYIFIYIAIYKLIKSKIDILIKSELVIKNYIKS